MSKADKLVARMRGNPGGWRITDLEAIARQVGIVVRKSPGSHVYFQHRNSPIKLSVPAHRPIKPIYIKHFLALIDDIEN